MVSVEKTIYVKGGIRLAKKSIIIAFLLVLTFGLMGCGGGGSKEPSDPPVLTTVAISGTVDDGIVSQTRALVTGVELRVYNFQTGILLGSTIIGNDGRYQVPNIPIGLDLLLVVLVDDNDGNQRRLTRVILDINPDTSSGVNVDPISSGIAEVLGKMFKKGIDVSVELYQSIYEDVQSMGAPNLIIGVIIPASYGDELNDDPNNTNNLSHIQRRRINETRYMKAMELVDKLRNVSFTGVGLDDNLAYHINRGTNLMSRAMMELESGIDSIPQSNFWDYFNDQTIFCLQPGEYKFYSYLDELKLIDTIQPQVGEWKLHLDIWYNTPAVIELTRTKSGRCTMKLTFFDGSYWCHYYTIEQVFVETEDDNKFSIKGDIKTTNLFRDTAGVTSGYQCEMTGGLDASVTFDPDTGKVVLASLRFDGTARYIKDYGMADDDLVINGTFSADFDQATVGEIAFTGTMESDDYLFRGNVSVEGYPKGEKAAFTGATVEMERFECKRTTGDSVPYIASGRLDIQISNPDEVRWTEPFSSANHPTGTLIFAGEITPEKLVAQSFRQVLTLTDYQTGTLETEFFYDLPNQKKIDLTCSASPNELLELTVTSPLGVALHITRDSNNIFDGNIMVDNIEIGRVKQSSSECTIQFNNERRNTMTLWAGW